MEEMISRMLKEDDTLLTELSDQAIATEKTDEAARLRQPARLFLLHHLSRSTERQASCAPGALLVMCASAVGVAGAEW